VADYLGWTATVVFAASYFCQEPVAMRRVQMAGAAMWIAYGVLMHAGPVVVANLLVLCAAAWAGRGGNRSQPAGVGLEPRPNGIRG
jgi:hypothetical protein